MLLNGVFGRVTLPRVQVVRTSGLEVAYERVGEGPPLVLSASWLTHLEHQWRSLAWKPWLEHFRYGPFEWLWRSLARWELQPMRKPVHAVAE